MAENNANSIAFCLMCGCQTTKTAISQTKIKVSTTTNNGLNHHILLFVIQSKQIQTIIKFKTYKSLLGNRGGGSLVVLQVECPQPLNQTSLFSDPIIGGKQKSTTTF